MHDPKAIAALYESLAVTRQEQGDYEAALAYGRRSLAAYEQLHDLRQIGSSWNTIGWVYIQRKAGARAREALDRADAIATETQDGRLAAYVLQSRAELALAEGAHEEALRLAQASVDHPAASARCRAVSALVKAEALAQTKAADADVDAAFQHAIDSLAPQGRQQVARAHRKHFEALVARGRSDDAVSAAKQAFDLARPRLE